MNPIRPIRRLAAALAGLAGALLASAAAAPAAFATPPPTHSWYRRPPLPPAHVHQFVPMPIPVRTVVMGGMSGWQIALIAIGALAAAVIAVMLDPARTVRRLARPATRPPPAHLPLGLIHGSGAGRPKTRQSLRLARSAARSEGLGAQPSDRSKIQGVQSRPWTSN
jgi:hypothetical protein